MKTFRTTHVVRHSAEDMFNLVADVESYPQFLPLCEALQVRERRETETGEVLIADMTVAFKLFHETFRSRITLDRSANEILTTYLQGPFREMQNRWKFRSTSDGSTEIDFYLAYELRTRALQLVAGAVFDRAFSKFADAFEQRADTIYGRKTRAAVDTVPQA